MGHHRFVLPDEPRMGALCVSCSRHVRSTEEGRRASWLTQVWSSRDWGERGSSLILAMIFLTVVSLIAISLTTWVGSDLINTVNFQVARSTQNAADAVAEMAIQYNRYNFLGDTVVPGNGSLSSFTFAPCLTSTTSELTMQMDGQSVSVSVWCATSWNPLSTNTRTLTLVACSSASASSATACQASPLLTVTVVFDDYPNTPTSVTATNCTLPASTGNPSSVVGTGTDCGLGMAITSWIFA